MRLTPQNLSLGIGGEYWIMTSRKKTNQPVRIPLVLALIEITVNKLEHTLNELEHLLENTKVEVTLEIVNVAELIESLIQENKAELNKIGISVSVKVEHQTNLYTDSQRVKMILSLIFSNAITFFDQKKDKKEVNISVRVLDSNFEVSIADNGIGIAPENQYQASFKASQIHSFKPHRRIA